MFGHGQFEGYKEHYGMDFLQPFINEIQDEDLISRHKKFIQPLLKNRYKYSYARNFKLLDYYQSHGKVNHNVLAFSNQYSNSQSLIIFNNANKKTSGFIKVPLEVNKYRSVRLIDFFTKDEFQISSSTRTNQDVSIDLSPYECKVFDVESV